MVNSYGTRGNGKALAMIVDAHRHRASHSGHSGGEDSGPKVNYSRIGWCYFNYSDWSYLLLHL